MFCLSCSSCCSIANEIRLILKSVAIPASFMLCLSQTSAIRSLKTFCSCEIDPIYVPLSRCSLRNRWSSCFSVFRYFSPSSIESTSSFFNSASVLVKYMMSLGILLKLSESRSRSIFVICFLKTASCWLIESKSFRKSLGLIGPFICSGVNDGINLFVSSYNFSLSALNYSTAFISFCRSIL